MSTRPRGATRTGVGPAGDAVQPPNAWGGDAYHVPALVEVVDRERHPRARTEPVAGVRRLRVGVDGEALVEHDVIRGREPPRARATLVVGRRSRAQAAPTVRDEVQRVERDDQVHAASCVARVARRSP